MSLQQYRLAWVAIFQHQKRCDRADRGEKLRSAATMEINVVEAMESLTGCLFGTGHFVSSFRMKFC
jgi:hypothetical protein